MASFTVDYSGKWISMTAIVEAGVSSLLPLWMDTWIGSIR